MAQVNAGRVRFVSRGEYNNSTQYYTLDLVNYDGSSYYAKENVVGVLPTDNTKWQLVAEKGSIGSTGATGPSGFSPSASVTQLQNGALISITDENGTTTANIQNGEVTNKELDYYKTISNVLPKVEDEDTELTLNNTGNAPLSIGLKGNTYQDSTNGNQLIDFSDLSVSSGTSYTFINDILIISSTVDRYNRVYKNITNLVKNNPGKVLNLQYDNLDTSEIGNGRFGRTLAIIKSGETTYHNFGSGAYEIPNDTSDITSVTFNLFQNNTGSSAPGNVKITKPLLYFNNNNTYEKYTGGIASPNPDYPQDIHVVSGDNTITISNNDGTQEQVYPINLGVENLYDISTYPVGVVSATRVGNLTRMPLKKGTYTFSYKGGDEMYYMIYDSSTGGNKIKETSWASGAITFTLDNDYYFTYRIRKSNDASISPSDVSEIQLEEGEKANSYSPYGITPIELCKIGDYQDDIRKSTGVQLANFYSAYYSSAEHEIVNGKVDLSEITSSRGVTFKFDEITLPAGNYCFAFNPLTKGSNTSNQQISSLNATFHFMPSGYSYCDFTLTEETTLSQFGFWYTANYAGILENIMLFSGTHENIPNWEPYGKDKWIKYGAIGKETDDIGSTDITINDMVSNSSIYSYCGGTVNGKTITYASALTVENTIYYPLVTPEITEITDSNLISQLDDIEYAMSYKEQTNISQENNDMPFIIPASAFKDLSNL